MLWQAWQQDYGEQASDRLRPKVEADQEQVMSTDIPTAQKANQGQIMGTDIPTAQVAESPPKTREFVEVETDVYRIRISKVGAELSRVELIHYPIAADNIEQPVVLLDGDNSPAFYIAQGGLLSTAESPTHKTIFNTQATRYTLEKEQQTLDVPFVWESADGLKVTKHYQFTRGVI